MCSDAELQDGSPADMAAELDSGPDILVQGSTAEPELNPREVPLGP